MFIVKIQAVTKRWFFTAHCCVPTLKSTNVHLSPIRKRNLVKEKILKFTLLSNPLIFLQNIFPGGSII